MAKTGISDSDPTVTARVNELKRELEKLVKSIVDDDEYSINTIDRAKETLFALKQVKLRNRLSASPSSSLRHSGHDQRQIVACPPEFFCPLSKELMKDPVILSTGQTYDRPFIQKWLKAGNRTCPTTQQVLSHTILVPNHLIREMILQWCKSQGLDLPDPIQYVDDDPITKVDRDRFLSLLDNMSSSLPEQKAAAKELRLLTKRMPSFRALFGESLDAIMQLLTPLSQKKSTVHPNLQEDVITTLLNLSIHDSNKKLVAETPVVIPLLMDALKSGTMETRANAAAAIFTLSALDSNKMLIGKSGAIKPLVDLLEMGHPLAMKDAASAIFNLCMLHENKSRAVKDGAVKVILDKITSGVHVDELLAILAMLSSHQRAVEEMGELEAVPCLLHIIRENSCERNKENSIAVLYLICYNDRRKLKEIWEEENSFRTVSKLARDGTSRAKRKANSILERLNRGVNLTHTA